MNDNFVTWFIHSVAIIFTFLLWSFVVWIYKHNILIPEQDWKCTHAIILDDDPSKTECTVYKKNDQ
jgi:hypothetical protein